MKCRIHYAHITVTQRFSASATRQGGTEAIELTRFAETGGVDLSAMNRDMRLGRAAALLYAAVSVGVVVFQIALAAGAPWGAYAMGGAFPGQFPLALRIAALAQAALIAGMAVGRDVAGRPRSCRMVWRDALAGVVCRRVGGCESRAQPDYAERG